MTQIITEQAGQPKKKRGKGWLIALIIMIILLALACAGHYAMTRKTAIMTKLKYGIDTVRSPCDADGDHIDDLTDIMLNARRYIETNPDYIDDYCAGGYPPEGQGVCTDVIWRALQGAGYDFKAMVDEDISKNQKLYPLPNGLADANIDFRRVVNLKVFFERHCEVLTCDTSDAAQWQAGDFIVYDGHIAVASDKRNEKGQPWIIHHMGTGPIEADMLDYRPVIGHYRWLLRDEAEE